MTSQFNDCWFLTGATAVGKTSVGIALAQSLNAEIISLDSMAIYRGMDIGTAKPPRELRGLVPHHLIDIVEPSAEYSVAQYVDAATAVVDDVRRRGKVPLFVGGTPLYLKSLLRGLFNGPPADWKARREIEAELQHVGGQALFDRLAQIDPIAASNIHPNDTRRLIRALEVFRATGEPISHQQMQFEDGRQAEDCRVFVLRRQREELHQRIEMRVRAMIDAGLVDEVRGLIHDGRELSRTARQAVGYNEALAFLNGEYDQSEMVARITYHTRRFAKRQGTWFRSLSECRFVDITGESQSELIADEMARIGENC